MNFSIKLNPNLESSIPYTLSLGMHSTPIPYVRLNMIDLSILIMVIKYAIKDLALINCKHEATKKIQKKTWIAIKKRKSITISLEFLDPRH